MFVQNASTELELSEPAVQNADEDDEDYDPRPEEWVREIDMPQTAMWRAVRLGCHAARFTSSFTATVPHGGDFMTLWLGGRIPGQDSIAPQFDPLELVNLSLVAGKLLMVHIWPPEEDGILWLPSADDLESVPDYLTVESTKFLEEWLEILGERPDLNLNGLMMLALEAASGKIKSASPANLAPATAPTRRHRRPAKNSMS